MNWSNLWLMCALFAALVLVGCFGANPDGEVEPEPSEQNETTNQTVPEPLAPPRVRGLVSVAGGGGLAGLSVHAAATDLTLPINNIQLYREELAATYEYLDTDNGFSFDWTNLNGSRIALRAPGMAPYYSEPINAGPGEEVWLNVTMQPLNATVTAHRGGAFYAPENSLSALHKAGLLGVPRAEIDVQWTQDEVFVLWHDGVVEDQAGERIWMRTSDDVMATDIGSEFDESFAGETVPTMDDALAVMALYGTVPVIEIKITDDPRHALMMQAAVDAVVAAGLESEAVVISFDPSYDAHCGAMGLLCGYIEANPNGVRTDPAGVGKDAFAPLIVEHHMPKEVATADYIAESQEAGLLVTAWTVNEVDEAVELAARGVDGITTDAPAEVIAALYYGAQ